MLKMADINLEIYNWKVGITTDSGLNPNHWTQNDENNEIIIIFAVLKVTSINQEL